MLITLLKHLKRRTRLRSTLFLNKVARILHGKNLTAYLVQSEHGVFAIDPDDMAGVGGSLLKNGTYGQSELERLKAAVRPSDTVLIVGAHIGCIAVPLSKACEKVISIEANPRSFELLQFNLALNSCFNCSVYNIAANDTQGPIEFLMNRANSGGSKRMPAHRSFDFFYDNPRTISVGGQRLDSFLKNESVDVIVMDIEGSEVFALRGMQAILEEARVLQIEFLPRHIKDVAGASIDEFVGLLAPHFEKLTIPSLNHTVSRGEFWPLLSRMFETNQGDDSLLFEK